jgi:hypothetical protein
VRVGTTTWLWWTWHPLLLLLLLLLVMVLMWVLTVVVMQLAADHMCCGVQTAVQCVEQLPGAC